MSEFHQEFKNYLIRQALQPRTITQHIIRINLLQREIKNFTFEEVEAYLTKRIAAGAAGSTINKFVQTINKWCDFKGLDWGKKVKKIRENNRTKVLLSDDEITAFIALDPPPSTLGLFWMCMACTGARIPEITHLTINDIDTANKLLLFHETKTGEGRSVPITPSLMEALEAHVKTVPEGYLFPTRPNRNSPWNYHKEIGYTTIANDFKRRKKALGITKAITPYSLRHSFVTRLLTEANAPLFVVQDIVGHKSANTTRRYYHGSVKAMHSAIQQDPLMRRSINPQTLLSQLIKYVREFLERDNRFWFEIIEKEGEFSIKIKVKDKE